LANGETYEDVNEKKELGIPAGQQTTAGQNHGNNFLNCRRRKIFDSRGGSRRDYGV